jgi:hypothetical protein
VPWVLGSTGGVWLSWLLMRSDSGFAGTMLLLLSLAILWGSSKTLWRNRRPFVFTVRGNRKVKFRGGGRDETVVEEDGRKVRIFTELLVGNPSRGIHPSSMKYEAPYEGEPLTDERKEEILDLLCEEYDYQGIRYEVVMNSKLSVTMPCPRCKEYQIFEINLPFGCIGERHYRIGDKIEWQPNRPAEKGGRPDNGNLRKSVWVRCPTCSRDFWLAAYVSADRIEKVEVDSSQSVMIPDDSIPIVEGGKIVGHRVEP